MEGERGSKNINMVSELAKCPSHSKGMLHTYLGGLEKKKKKTSLCVRGSVGSPTSAGHGLIELNIYE